ncbi:MAG: bifunctional riboflavin kinase/FAD synthetase [Acidobacteriota bacterium]|nr:bifunctional riboflavin kinase/FAD synthetase [Acidobacteriota bacterium]
MRVFNALEEFSTIPKGAAVAIGNFDGLHLGHQKILETLCASAREKKLISLVLTFSPHPEKVLHKKPVLLVQTIEQRLEGLSKLGIQTVLVTSGKEFFSLPGRDFARDVLAGRLRARAVVVGDSFRFGRHRDSDTKDLESCGRLFGFAVLAVPPVHRKGAVVSSSLLRTLLAAGRVVEAGRMLGRPYEIEGIVVQGLSRGRTLGFPTINTRPLNEITPPGVFATSAAWDSRTFPAVTNIGLRPTFGPGKTSIETHILDFEENTCGEKVRIQFLKKLRDEKKFASPEELARQIGRDVRRARAFFGR